MTTVTSNADWDPAGYLRFAGERARPFTDLVGRVGASDPRVVVDLGCGDGSTTALLARRWPGASVTGVDSSAAMLAAAAEHAVPGRLEFTAGDVRDWRAGGAGDGVGRHSGLARGPGPPGPPGCWGTRPAAG